MRRILVITAVSLAVVLTALTVWAIRSAPRLRDRVVEAHRDLIGLRRASDALARGGIRYVHVGDDAIAYLRETRDERLLCLAARADHAPLRHGNIRGQGYFH